MKIRQPREMLADNLIVKHLAGSRAYGTNLPTSDTDIRGIFCADEVYHRSPWFTVNEISIPEEDDTKYYELTKFLQLLVDQNPNILESLWVDESSILESSAAYEFLRGHRYDLLSSKTAFTFSGYAVSQLKRIKGHNKWINNPQPVEAPRQTDYMSLVQNFTPSKIMKMDHETLSKFHKENRFIPYGGNILGIYQMSGYELYDEIFTLNINDDDVKREELGYPHAIVKWNKEEYRQAKEFHKNYWTWKKNRNESRSELEEQFGYDTKHAMHLVRLLRMGKEILTEGEVKVLRPDAAELLEIRNGKWTYEELVEYAEGLDNDIRTEHYKNSVVGKKIDPKLATRILFEAQEICWAEK